MNTTLFKLAAILLFAAITIASLGPTGGSPSIPHMDKIIHFAAYGVLASGIALGWPRWGWLRVVIIATLLGASVEFMQGAFTSGRTMSVLDGLANMAGALSFTAIINRVRSRS